MKIRYSTPDSYGVLYVELQSGEYAESIPMEDDLLVVDVDAIGIEILDLSGFLERVKVQGGTFEIPDQLDLEAPSGLETSLQRADSQNNTEGS